MDKCVRGAIKYCTTLTYMLKKCNWWIITLSCILINHRAIFFYLKVQSDVRLSFKGWCIKNWSVYALNYSIHFKIEFLLAYYVSHLPTICINFKTSRCLYVSCMQNPVWYEKKCTFITTYLHCKIFSNSQLWMRELLRSLELNLQRYF